MLAPDTDRLVDRASGGDLRALARLVSLIENGSPQLRPIMRALAPRAGGARVIGLTGAPGVGKSTLTGALVKAYRGRGQRVGVIAVDPSSPFTGGALLGDRIRMQDHATDEGVFIRSMASRGHLGGLAAATPQALRVLDAAGFDLVLIETVGVGQAELEIASLADTTIVLVAPGMGDAIQAAKAGILEVADVFAVNKADRPQAQQTVRDLRNMIALGHQPDDGSPATRAGPAGSPRSSAPSPPPGRASASWPTRSTRTGPGCRPPGSASAGGWPGPGKRWPRSPSARCAGRCGGCRRAPGLTSSRAGSPAARWTPTPPPTSWSAPWSRRRTRGAAIGPDRPVPPGGVPPAGRAARPAGTDGPPGRSGGSGFAAGTDRPPGRSGGSGFPAGCCSAAASASAASRIESSRSRAS